MNKLNKMNNFNNNKKNRGLIKIFFKNDSKFGERLSMKA